MKRCSASDCDRSAASANAEYCLMHYQRVRNHGHTGSLTGRGKTQKFIDDLLASEPCQDCVIWPYFRNANGYGVIRRSGDNTLVHRHILEKISPKPSRNHYALHECGKGHDGCVNPLHLYWGTKADNVKDSVRDGTYSPPPTIHQQKLCASKVIEIFKDPRTQKEIATDFGLHYTTVGRIKNGQNWSHVTGA